MNIKKETLIVIILCLIMFLLACGLSYYILEAKKANKKECEKCKECEICDKQEVIDNSTKYGDEYFSDDEFMYSSYIRGAYLLSSLRSETDHGKAEEHFVSKLIEKYEGKNIDKETTYSIMDLNNEKLYITLKANGTYSAKQNMCEGYTIVSGTYKIYNNEVIVIGTKNGKHADFESLMFLYQDKKYIQTITYRDCAIYEGYIFVAEK